MRIIFVYNLKCTQTTLKKLLHSVLLPPLRRGGIFFLTYLLEERGKVFFHYFGGGRNSNFYNPKIEICKINYCENKVKLNNKDDQ